MHVYSLYVYFFFFRMEQKLVFVLLNLENLKNYISLFNGGLNTLQIHFMWCD